MKNKDIYNFLISLARDLNKFYKLKLNKKFKAKNKGCLLYTSDAADE